MKIHSVLAQHPSEPRATVEADIDLARLLDHNFETPGLELFFDPGLSMGQGRGSDRTASDVVGEMVLVIHHAVVRLTDLDDLLDGLVLSHSGEGHDYRKDNPKKESSFHNKQIC